MNGDLLIDCRPEHSLIRTKLIISSCAGIGFGEHGIIRPETFTRINPWFLKGGNLTGAVLMHANLFVPSVQPRWPAHPV